MHIPTHILSGWIVGNALPRLDARGRLCCMIAASAADLDGLGFFFGEEAYWRFHHVVGHNVFVGLLGSAALAFYPRRHRLLTFAACIVCFHLHLLMDFYGSGPGWEIHYLWPLDGRGFKTTHAWPLMSWQNYLAFALLGGLTFLIARRRRRTPVELLLPRIETQMFRRDLEGVTP